MGKRASSIVNFDVGDTARVLSFDAEQCRTGASFRTVNEEQGSQPRKPKRRVRVHKNGDDTSKFQLI